MAVTIMINIMPESQSRHDNEKAKESQDAGFICACKSPKSIGAVHKMSLFYVFRMLSVSENTNKKYN
ncbi:hypothetical protein GE278_14735 [Enterobacteriaceae bacterium Kacie_13]|nr:hypothetical protein GE278_14735 [Enterobacteriaceae bacterium Kacie_13]